MPVTRFVLVLYVFSRARQPLFGGGSLSRALVVGERLLTVSDRCVRASALEALAHGAFAEFPA